MYANCANTYECQNSGIFKQRYVLLGDLRGFLFCLQHFTACPEVTIQNVWQNILSEPQRVEGFLLIPRSLLCGGLLLIRDNDAIVRLNNVVLELVVGLVVHRHGYFA